jgi:hypothetical protein
MTVRPGKAPINTPLFQGAPAMLSQMWQGWFTSLAALFSSNTQTTLPAVGASPFVYQNTFSYIVQAIVSAGTVSAVAWSRDGTNYYNLPFATAGSVVLLSSGDYIRVTYTVAPTLVIAPI